MVMSVATPGSQTSSIFDVFDAKVNAEMAVGVGYEWDSVVIMRNGFHDVPKAIKDLIEKAWGKYNRSPFEKYDPKEHEKGPPHDWKERLETFFSSLSVKPTRRGAIV